jgi:hypothetical protein
MGFRQCRRHSQPHAAELVALAPDIILASGTASMGPLQQATRTVPIVFTIVNVRIDIRWPGANTPRIWLHSRRM